MDEYLSRKKLLDRFEEILKFQEEHGFNSEARMTRSFRRDISLAPAAEVVLKSDLAEIFNAIEQLIQANTRLEYDRDGFTVAKYDLNSIKNGISGLKSKYIGES